MKTFKYRRLAAFDFDHTIVNDNTDIVARNLIDSKLISNDIKELYTASGWIPYMQKIFQLLHQNQITMDTIRSSIRSIPEVNGMMNLIKSIRNADFDIVIMSDSNAELIRTWIESNNLCQYFNQVFTNPAKFNSDGYLQVEPYSHQTDCNLCSVNLCKGSILEKYIKQCQNEKNIIYQSIYYVGDGKNDICPILKLGKMDFGCPRIGYRLDKNLEQIREDAEQKLDANMIRWNDGCDLLKQINETLAKSDDDSIKELLQTGIRKLP